MILILKENKTCSAAHATLKIRKALLPRLTTHCTLSKLHLSLDKAVSITEEAPMLWGLLSKSRWEPLCTNSMLSQNYLKAGSQRDKTSLASVMASRKYSPKIDQIKKLLFQSLVMEATDAVTDPRISSEKVSENRLFNLKNWKETLEAHRLSDWQ